MIYFSFLKWVFLEFQVTKAFGLAKFLFYIYSPPSKVGLFASLFVSFLSKLTLWLISFLPYMRFHSLWFLPAAYMAKAASCAFLSKNHDRSATWSLSLYSACIIKDKCRIIFTLLVPFIFHINHLSQRIAVFSWTAFFGFFISKCSIWYMLVTIVHCHIKVAKVKEQNSDSGLCQICALQCGTTLTYIAYCCM